MERTFRVLDFGVGSDQENWIRECPVMQRASPRRARYEQDEPIHPLNRAFDVRVKVAVNAFRGGAQRQDLVVVHGHIVVDQAEAYLRGEPVLRIRQFGKVRKP